MASDWQQNDHNGVPAHVKLFPQADRQLLPRNPAQGYPRQQGDQYESWWPQVNNPDRQRILDIAVKNPACPPYISALARD
jgi:hypothetical protein